MTRLVITNGTLLDQFGERRADIAVADGVIVAVGTDLAAEHRAEPRSGRLEILGLAVGLEGVLRGVLFHEDVLGGRAPGLVELVGEAARLVGLNFRHQVFRDLLELGLLAVLDLQFCDNTDHARISLTLVL